MAAKAEPIRSRTRRIRHGDTVLMSAFRRTRPNPLLVLSRTLRLSTPTAPLITSVWWIAFDGGHIPAPQDGAPGDSSTDAYVSGETWDFFSQFTSRNDHSLEINKF